MRKFIVFAALASTLLADQAHAAMEAYCQSPPFISTAAAPNVMLMVDTSGSMSDMAYSSAAYDPTKLYEGYFNPEKDYALDASGVYVETGTSTCAKVCTGTWTCAKNNSPGGDCVQNAFGCGGSKKWACCSQWTTVDCGGNGNGNYLNYQNMARIDLLRWALTGGKPSGCTGSIQTCEASLYLQPSSSVPCNADGCTMETNAGVKVKAKWTRITGDAGGLLYQLKSLPVQPRMGSMYFRDTEVKNTVLVGDFTGSASVDGVNPYKNTAAALNSEAPAGATPTGPALWAAYNYFAQQPAIFGGPGPQTGGAEWKNPMYQCFDANNDGNCQGNELVLVPCAKNFMILLTDGQWNKGGASGSVVSTCSIDTGYENASADPVVPAYWLHKKGYTNVPTNIASNMESVYTVGLWLGGSGEKSLKNVAMYGGFDTGKTWPGGTTGYPQDSGCVATDCVGATKGSPCTDLPSPPSALTKDWDNNADGLPDNFFSASDAGEIKTKIMTVILDIMRRASSGTAVSVLSSSEGSGANLMQALFYPKRTFSDGTDISWTSDLMNYWYYLDPYLKSLQIREDTVREDANYTLLDLKTDYITEFTYDSSQNKTLAHRWLDSTGTGSVLTDLGTVPIEEAMPIWRAGFNLWWTDPASRTVKTTVDGSSLVSFTTANSNTLKDSMGQTDAQAQTTIDYVRGVDLAGGRGRTVTTGVCSARRSPCSSAADCPGGETCDQETHVWKLGDIISSTPRIMGPAPLNNFNTVYNDKTYSDFIKSDDYKERQLAFVGANDGMLHAFRLGKLLQNWTGKQWYEAGRQEGTTGAGGIGTEAYAFIPQNVLPYLQYLQDEDYCHIYMTDGPATITEASINKPSTCTLANYWDCPKVTTMQAAPNTNKVDFGKTSWRTVLVGSMGVGGATNDTGTADADRISTPITGSSVGLSSYYALDVTDQSAPTLLWEFSNANLGVTNIGPAIIRVGDKTTNGRWFAILASGSTGPITSMEFRGTSDKNLRLFVLDLKTGTLLRTIDTGIANAFAGSITTSAVVDLEKDMPSNSGNYQDDAVYIGYVQNTTNGGVLRLVINDDIDPANWTANKVIENIGPVTTSVVDLIDRRNNKLWLYFAEGRFSHKQDDLNTQRKLFGIQEPCFDKKQCRISGAVCSTDSDCGDIATNGNCVSSMIHPTCTDMVTLADLKNQTTLPSSTLSTEKGWYINMASVASPESAERVISNPVALSTGAVFFVSFAPTADICGFGGTTYLWALDYKTGGSVTFLMQGKALLQVSTGEIKEMPLGSAFTEKEGRRSIGFKGIPPAGEAAMILSNPTDIIRKMMHVQEQ